MLKSPNLSEINWHGRTPYSPYSFLSALFPSSVFKGVLGENKPRFSGYFCEVIII